MFNQGLVSLYRCRCLLSIDHPRLRRLLAGMGFETIARGRYTYITSAQFAALRREVGASDDPFAGSDRTKEWEDTHSGCREAELRIRIAAAMRAKARDPSTELTEAVIEAAVEEYRHAVAV
jgi:hypothetical protein